MIGEEDGPSARCRLPHRGTLPRGVALNLCEVPGGFVNMTSLDVPAYVSSYLSLGPKYMLPSFGHFNEEAVAKDWDCLYSTLHRAGCLEALFQPLLGRLKYVHKESMGSVRQFRRRELRVMYQAQAVEEYLCTHPSVMVVDGDKGKKTGLIERSEFDKMCLKFLSKGVSSGQYKSYSSLCLETYLGSSRAHYMCIVNSYNPSSGMKRLYLPSCKDSEKLADGRNLRVYHVLKKAEWVVPTFIPSVKYHKTPLAIRPVVSKKGSASMSVGVIVSEALTLMRYVHLFY